MTLILKEIFALIKLLSSDTGLISLSLAVTIGFILGLSPFLSLQALIIFMVLLFFRIQVGMALITAFFTKFIAFFLDSFAHKIGSWFLGLDSLFSFFTYLYNAPLLPYTQFNNSVVMGSGLMGIILSPFIFFLSYYLIKKYRIQVVDRFKQTKFWKMIKATSLYKWYYRYDNLYGDN